MAMLSMVVGMRFGRGRETGGRIAVMVESLRRDWKASAAMR